MPAGRYDITIEQGATYAEDFTWEVDASPVDLTGATATLTMRAAPGGELLAALTPANGGLILGGTAGTIGARLDATATAALPAGDGRYDLEISFGAIVVRLLQGRVSIRPEITRP